MIHGRSRVAVGAARIAACRDWNWPEPSAATTASAHAGGPGELAGWAREARAASTVAIAVTAARSRRSIMVASGGILSGSARRSASIRVHARSHPRFPRHRLRSSPRSAAPRGRGAAPPAGRRVLAEGRRGPAPQPRRPVGRLHAHDARREGGRLRHRRLPRVDGRRRAPAPHVLQEGGLEPPLQPGRGVDRVPLGPRGKEDAGVPHEPERRRGGEAHRLQGLGLGPRLVPRLQAARPRGPRRRPRRAGRGGRGEARGREEGDGEADRPAPPAVQARRRRLPPRGPEARPRLRRREEDLRPGHLGSLRRFRPRLVARRPVDRLREQPHAARPRPVAGRERLRGRGPRGRHPPRHRDESRHGRLPGLEPRREMGRLRRRRRPEGLLVRREPRRPGPGRRRGLAAAHRRARPQRDEPPLHARRPRRAVPPRGPGQPAPRPRERRGRGGRARRLRRARRAGVRRGARRRRRRARELGPAASRDLGGGGGRRAPPPHPRERRLPEERSRSAASSASRPRARTGRSWTAS